MNTNKFAYEVPGLSTTFMTNKNLKGYRFGGLKSGLLDYPAAGADALGVIRDFVDIYPRTVDNDEFGVQVTLSGILRVEAEVAIAENEAIYVGAEGKATNVKGASGIQIGLALTPAKAGSLVSVLIK